MSKPPAPVCICLPSIAPPDDNDKTECPACSKPPTNTCVGCFNLVRPGHPEDHANGCPTGQNGTPNYE